VAYATVDDLAFALRVTVTVKNQDKLQSCLDASAFQIDHHRDPLDGLPLPDTDPGYPLAHEINVAHAVEIFKASDAAFGGVGFQDTGILKVATDSFARYAIALTPLTEQWGIG
jgi:hypothetical protein